MKKKLMSLLLLTALLLTGCGGKKQVVAPEYDWMESGANISIESQENSEVESTEVESTEVESSEAKTPSVTESSEEPSSEEASSTEPTVETPVVNMPGSLSDNLYDFQIQIDDEVLQFPMWYSDFVALGWTYAGDPSDSLDAMSYYSFTEFAKDGMEFDFVVYNYGINAMPVSECLICGVSMDEWNMDGVTASIVLPGGITYGTSTLADLDAVYGAPEDTYEGTYYTEYTYRSENGYYSSIRLEVSTETNVLSSIDMQNLIELEGIAPEANMFYDEVPAMAANYVAPTAMSDNLQDYTVKVGDVILSVPAPLSVLMADGWVIDDEIEVIPGRWSEYMYLKKGDQRLSVSVINTHDNAVAVENAMIYDIEASSYNKPENVEYAAGIVLGMTEDELLKALEGYTYESSDYDTSRVYNLELEDDYNTSYSIWIREGVVDQMSVSYRPDSLFE